MKKNKFILFVVTYLLIAIAYALSFSYLSGFMFAPDDTILTVGLYKHYISYNNLRDIIFTIVNMFIIIFCIKKSGHIEIEWEKEDEK